MQNEEIKNVGTEEIEVITDLEMIDDLDIYEDSNSSGAGLIVLAVGAAIAGAGAALYHKNKAKIEDWRIKRWEKKGYVISKIVDTLPEETPIEPEDTADDEPVVKKKAPKKAKKEEE